MVLAMPIPALAADPVILYAAGSLRSSLTEIADDFEKASGFKVQTKFGASGLLKDEIAAGAPAEVFASANTEHPQALAAKKKAGPVVLFARNQMCVLARPGGRSHDDDAARPNVGSNNQARYLDAAGRSLGRLCVECIPQGRDDKAGRLCGTADESA
jgi:ABC-type molybdate transport system substrate-binding protein